MDIKINNAMRHVMGRVKTAGLHEVAKREYKLEKLTTKHAATILGAELLKIANKYEAVRSGLDSLDEVADDIFDKTASAPSSQAGRQLAELLGVRPEPGLIAKLFGARGPTAGEHVLEGLKATGGMAALGGLGGGLVGGTTGALDPDSTFLEGAGRGALLGAGTAGMGEAAAQALLRGADMPIAALGAGTVGGLGVLPAGLAGGLDTSGRRKRRRELADASQKEASLSEQLLASGIHGAGGAMAGGLGGGVLGGLTGGITGAIDPESSALQGAGQGALRGAGIGALGGGASGALLPHAALPASILSHLTAAGALGGGISGGLDTSGKRDKRNKHIDREMAEKEASMFDLKQLKSLLPVGDDVAHAASSALPDLAGAGGSAGHSGMFSQFDLPAVSPKQTIRGGLAVDPRAIPSGMPDIRPLPKIGHWLKLGGPPPIPAAVKQKSMVDAAAKKLFSMEEGVGHLFGGAGAAKPRPQLPQIAAAGSDPMSVMLRNSGTQLQEGMGQMFGTGTLTPDHMGRLKQLEDAARLRAAR